MYLITFLITVPCLLVTRLSPEGVDIVLDCLCGEDSNKGIALLKPLGKYILYGKPFCVGGTWSLLAVVVI